VKACATIAAVLDQRSESDEAQGYKAWVFDIADQVASSRRTPSPPMARSMRQRTYARPRPTSTNHED
jgi:hypothetical protein